LRQRKKVLAEAGAGESQVIRPPGDRTTLAPRGKTNKGESVLISEIDDITLRKV